MGHEVKWYQCGRCMHSTSKLEDFPKAGRIDEQGDGNRVSMRKCTSCGALTPTLNLKRIWYVPTTKEDFDQLVPVKSKIETKKRTEIGG